MLPIFVLTLFLSSALLFVIEPMFAKMVLPRFGGTPVVWNTCMVFFQAALLAGYAYAHLLTRHLPLRRQTFLHLLVLLSPLAVLPVLVPAFATSSSIFSPVWSLLALLFVGVGLPFFVVSTSGPLLQRWFSSTGHPHARDPYFLYAASNLGSMVGLLAYPVLLEPWLSTREQSRWWTIGYLLLVLFTAACAWVALRETRRLTRVAAASAPGTLDLPHRPGAQPLASSDSSTPLTWRRCHRWILLAAVPSSMMLGLTMHLTTDIAAVPLLWVIPLAIYLLSFIVVFSRRPLIPHTLVLRVMPMLVLLLVLLLAAEASQPIWFVLPLHVLAFFAVALLCHGELAADRPAADHLTAYYLLMSAGGVLGGLFNALLAPLLFSSVAEYPLAVLAACFLRPALATPPHENPAVRRRARIHDFLYPAALLIVTVALIFACDLLHLGVGPLRSLITSAVPALLCFVALDRPVRFALGVGAILFAGTLDFSGPDSQLYIRRSFFGVHIVRRVQGNPVNQSAGADGSDASRTATQPGSTRYLFNMIVHGHTFHGMQRVDPQTRKPIFPQEPLLYYHPHGPIGEVMQTLLESAAPAESPPVLGAATRPAASAPAALPRVGLVGMGAGALAAYARPGQHFTFFEIDPVVEDLATRSGFFSYVPEARRRGAVVDVVLGDARLTLDSAADHSFDLLVLDAFSSDAIPLHLMTREALQLYLRKLAPDGVIAWHISNLYLRLAPVVAALAADAGLACWVCDDRQVSDWLDDNARGRSPSIWVVLTRDPARVAPLVQNPRWKRLPPPAHQAVWTDDFTNILSVLIWFNQGG